MKLKAENPDLPEEELRKMVMAKFHEMQMRMKEQQEKFQKEMQDPAKRAKMEEAQKKQEEEKNKRKTLLTSVAKKIDEWGLKQHNTVLGPNTIGYFRSKSGACLRVLQWTTSLIS